MTYKFICKNCNKEHEIEMRMSEYTDKQNCHDCNGLMERSISDYTTASAIWKCSGAYAGTN